MFCGVCGGRLRLDVDGESITCAMRCRRIFQPPLASVVEEMNAAIPPPPTCTHEGCEKHPYKSKLCWMHYKAVHGSIAAKKERKMQKNTKTHNGICTHDGCKKRIQFMRLCAGHFMLEHGFSVAEGRKRGMKLGKI